MSVSQELAVLISRAEFGALPAEAVEVAKTVILDGLAVSLAGAVEPPARIVAEYVREMGGVPRCAVWGQGFRTSPVMAAFANGVAGHVLDYEVMWHPATHATSPTLPGILALAEHLQRSGPEVLTALVIGFEVQGRLRLASAKLDLRGFHPPGLVGVMGSAAAAAVMLRLSAEQTRMALGIAASRAGGVSANTGTMTKATHCGNAGRLGLEAALLAAKGFTGHPDIFEHPAGYAAVYFGEGFDVEAVTRDFGNPYRMVDPGIAIKKHPSQYSTHRGIDAALELRQRYGIDPAQIAAVRIEAPVMRYTDRAAPRTGLEGKFSFQYTVAAALLDGHIGMETFTDAQVRRPEIAALLAKTRLEMNPQIPANFDEMWTTVTVELQNGATYSVRCDRPRGIWGNPLSHEERLTKVRQCAARVLSDADIERLIAIVEGLEHASSQDVMALLELLAQSPAVHPRR
jgi:2-methylcitrate dehydratase PrpD